MRPYRVDEEDLLYVRASIALLRENHLLKLKHDEGIIIKTLSRIAHLT
jgi:hypothetical protein